MCGCGGPVLPLSVGLAQGLPSRLSFDILTFEYQNVTCPAFRTFGVILTFFFP